MYPVQGIRKHHVRGHDFSKGILHPLLIEVTPQRILKFLVQRQLVMAVEKPGAVHREKLCNGNLFILQYPLCPPVPTSLISLSNVLHSGQRHLSKILIVFLQKRLNLRIVSFPQRIFVNNQHLYFRLHPDFHHQLTSTTQTKMNETSDKIVCGKVYCDDSPIFSPNVTVKRVFFVWGRKK